MLTVVLKLLGFLLLTLLVIPLAMLVRLTGRPQYILRLSQGYFQLVNLVIGLRVVTRGELAQGGARLLVSNHISYLDILAIGAAAPLTFVPKSEIAGWPLVGLCCKLMGCVFVDRRRSQTQKNMAALHDGLKDGKPLVLFAEGTTGSGKGVGIIRSSYFQLAEDFGEPLTVQPIRLTYTRAHGLPLDESQRYRIAWVGDEDLVPHLTHLLQMGPIEVEVEFLAPLEMTREDNRKTIARRCQQAFISEKPSVTG